jgi:hypothetical protein
MLPSTNIQSIVGATLFGAGQEKLGRISQVFVDAADGHPTWAEVHVGTLTRHAVFVPLESATWENDDVTVPYSKEQVKDAPRMDADGGLDPAQESELRGWFSGDVDRVPTRDPQSQSERASEPGPVRTDTPQRAPEPDRSAPDDDAVLREERLVVHEEKMPVSGRHLDRTTVTEDRQLTDDVRKERVDTEQDGTSTPPAR